MNCDPTSTVRAADLNVTCVLSTRVVCSAVIVGPTASVSLLGEPHRLREHGSRVFLEAAPSSCNADQDHYRAWQRAGAVVAAARYIGDEECVARFRRVYAGTAIHA